MEWIQSVVLGLVQGLTEFLPVSSTAHLRIVPALLNWEDPGAATSAVIQLGTMGAVVAFFWKDLVRIAVAWSSHLSLSALKALRQSAPEADSATQTASPTTHDAVLGWYLIAATIPIGFAGIMFKDQIETAARDLRLISIMLIVFGALLWWVDSALPQTKSAREFNLQSALAMGAAQALALIPGVSRSGATIAAGRVMGFSRESAARFSFLLSVPAVVLSGLYQALGNINTEEISWGPTLVATVVAFASGYASIAWLLKYLATNSMRNFALYRFLVGGPVLVLALVGAIR
ncbi:MAG: hypothetical protein RL745_468 [Actinomycetota bacterium]